MQLINQSVTILTPKSVIDANAKIIEIAGRTCYHSEDKITENSWKKFIRTLIQSGHTSVLEHSILTVKFVTDRGTANELVRHRHCAFSQESTRYCDYTKSKFGNEIKFIKPSWYESSGYEGASRIFYEECSYAEKSYYNLKEKGTKAEQRRNVLPLATATTLVMSASYREWRSVLELRLDKRAHPDMQFLMKKLLVQLYEKVPVIFDDLVLCKHMLTEIENFDM